MANVFTYVHNNYTNDIFCGQDQTMFYIVDSCPLTKLNGSLSRLHSADDDAVQSPANLRRWTHKQNKKKTATSENENAKLQSAVKQHNIALTKGEWYSKAGKATASGISLAIMRRRLFGLYHLWAQTPKTGG